MNKASIALHSPLLAGTPYWVTELSGNAELSIGFEYDIHLCTHTPLVMENFINSNLGLTLHYHQPSTDIHGVISHIQHRRSEDNHSHLYTLRLTSYFQQLTQHVSCAHFKNTPLVELIKTVIPPQPGFKLDTRFLHQSYSPVPYCVQYNESAYRFISRLLAEHGIFFFFSHQKGQHTLHLADTVQAYSAVQLYSLEGKQQQHVIDWNETWQATPQSVQLINTNESCPHQPIIAHSQLPSGITSLDLQYSVFPSNIVQGSAGETRLKQAQRRLLKPGHQLTSRSNILHLQPAMQIGLKQEHDRFVIIKSALNIRDHSNTPYSTPHTKPVTYQNTVTAIPSSIQFTPPLILKPQIQGAITANVTASSNQALEYNAQGKIKVHPHWLKPTGHKNDSTCWTRIMQNWAGTQYGQEWIHRTHDEVLIQYENSDPERPIILGANYNAINKPPIPAQQLPFVSGYHLQSLSTPSKKDHHWLFNDTPNQEQLSVQSRNDLEQKTTGSQSMNINQHYRHVTGHDDKTLVKNGRFHCTAKHTIRLQAGTNYIDISPNQITISGNKVYLN